MSKKIAIIGAGISGLSSAYLLCNDYSIKIFAKQFSPQITSNKAAAFWFPYHIRNDIRGIEWCKKCYATYQQLMQDENTGISMQQLKKVVRDNVEESEPIWVDFMPEGSCRMMDKEELDEGYSKGYDIQVPLIETQIFLPYLMNYLKNSGVEFITEDVTDLSGFKDSFDAVINCTGLGARILCHDEALIPVRGQVALLSPKKGLSIFLDNEKPVYIVPRKDAIIVGGTYEENIFTATTEPSTIERLLNNAYEVFSALKEQEVIGSWAGLRPYRPEVRVELESGTNIIHNYGHGGSGFSLAFGCADEVRKILQSLINP